MLRGIWQGRADRYSEIRAKLRETEDSKHKVEMFYIGG